MFTRNSCDSYTNRVLAGLVIAVTVVMGSLTHAVAGIQAFA